MTTLHINTTEVVADTILSYIETLSQKGNPIELIDNKIYSFERKAINEALFQEKNQMIYSSDEVLRELCSED